MDGKIIIISAPSGCGKSTIINALLQRGDIDLQFSISATSRLPRQGEVDGVNYYFLTEQEFRDKIEAGEFVEFEEVYPGRFYGTLRSEIDRVIRDGHNVVLDIDVAGALNVKRMYGERAMTLFIQPPSVDALRQRLLGRATETAEVIEERVGKAAYEIGFAPKFDYSVVNDDLDIAVGQVHDLISSFVAR